MVAAFYPVVGVESTWDERGGNSNSVRNSELIMERHDCLYGGWNVETATTHLETSPDQSEVETHIVQVGHIQDKPKKHGQFLGRDGEGKRIWTGSQNA